MASVEKNVRVASLGFVLCVLAVLILGCRQDQKKPETKSESKSGPKFNPQDSEETRKWLLSLNDPFPEVDGSLYKSIPKEERDRIQKQFDTATKALVWERVTWRFKVKSINAESAELDSSYGPPCVFYLGDKEPVNRKPQRLRQLPLAAMSKNKAHTIKAGDYVTVAAQIIGVSQEIIDYEGGKESGFASSFELKSVKVKD
jgi:hypothetical protein